jgi:hypothetical protein
LHPGNSRGQGVIGEEEGGKARRGDKVLGGGNQQDWGSRLKTAGTREWEFVLEEERTTLGRENEEEVFLLRRGKKTL